MQMKGRFSFDCGKLSFEGAGNMHNMHLENDTVFHLVSIEIAVPRCDSMNWKLSVKLGTLYYLLGAINSESTVNTGRNP